MSAKRKQDLLALPRGVAVSPTGLKITAQLSYSQWADMVQGLQRTHHSILWVIGDALVYGEKRWLERYSQAIEQYSEQTWLNALWVSSKVDPKIRRSNLSWSHHQQVASLPTAKQAEYLDLAVKQKLKVHELRKLVHTKRLIEEPEPKPDWQEPMDTPEIPPEEPEFHAVSEVRPSQYYPEFGEKIGDLERPARPMNLEADFNRLVGICRTLRAAEKQHNDAEV